MNEENGVEDAVEGPVVCVSREEVLQALNEIKREIAPGPSEVSLELIAACRGVGIQVLTEIYQSLMDFKCQLYEL